MKSQLMSYPQLQNEFYYQNELKVVHKKETLFEQLIQKQENIAVVGLGYVGLPLALHMASKYKVIGFDVNQTKIESLNLSIDPCEEVSYEEFAEKDIAFYHNSEALQAAKFYIVAVPTPIDENRTPNLTPLKKATQAVAKYLKKGDCVVFESTVYPGCTEEVCVPILEEASGLQFNTDFTVGYSPERINPGDKVHTFDKIKKIVSASTPEALEIVANVYAEVVTAGVHKAPNLKVAEAAKVVENTQRDVNIALMNELSYIFDKVGISIHDVLTAAGTKWNFLNFFPGLVGGHCIGVDPYYLIHKAEELSVDSQLVKASRTTNEKMPYHMAMKIIKTIQQSKKNLDEVNILVKGITFKENVKDIRNSKIINLIKTLKSFDFNVTIEDPYAEKEDVRKYYGYKLTDAKEIDQKFDAVIMGANHDTYHAIDSIEHLIHPDGFVFDIRGTFKHIAPDRKYFTI